MRPFFIKLYVITALLHVPFVLVLQRGLAALDVPGSWPAAAGCAALLAAAFHWRLRLARWDHPISTARMMLLEEPYFVHWCALVAAPVLLPVAVAATAAVTGEWLLTDAWIASYLAGLGLAAWGVVVRRRLVAVRHVDVEVAGLAEAFDGFAVAQLSDLHLGSMCPGSRVQAWVRRANDLNPDIVALTGDYVTSGSRFHHDIADALSGLRARQGVFAVMGNHDYFDEGEPLMTLLRRGGVQLLRNERIELERAGQRLCVAGVDDVFTKRIDISACLDGWDDSTPLVMLAHDPRSFPELAARGVTLVLSGHTHWGQLALPWLASRFNYARVVTQYHAGMYQQDGAKLYVNPGLGTTGPPIRFGTRPEITLLTLRRRVPSKR